MVATFISYDAKPPQSASEQGRPVLEGWHVVQVRTSMEQKTCDAIRDLGWTVYCPMEVKWRKPSNHETPAYLSRLTERRSAAISGAQAIAHAETRERALAGALRRFPRVSSIFGRNTLLEVRRAFIPGYAFVASDRTRDIDALKPSRHTRGIDDVMGVLQRSDGTFATVHQGVIDALMAAETQGFLDATRKFKGQFNLAFKKNQTVRLVGGAFDGFLGKVIRCARPDRIGVVLDMLGTVEVDMDQIESASEA